MKKLLVLSLILSFVAITILSYAEERAEICVKYQKDYGWSKGYAVEGIVISGSDLNSAVGSLSRFRQFSTYVVVFWDKDQASIFEMPSSSFGSVPIFETRVEDQEGRMWKIKEGHLLCH